MILFDHKEKVLKFLICINLLLLVLLVLKNFFYKKSINNEYNQVITSLIKSEGEATNINVEYPRFNDNDKVNKIITDLIYNYVKEFKSEIGNKSLIISYNTYYIKDFVNITFYIQNSLSNIKYKNIIIDLKNNKLSYISSIYNKEYLKSEISKEVYYKYPNEIYNIIRNENINNFTYVLSDEYIEVYFNNIDFDNINYIPYIIIDLKDNVL